MGSPFATGTVQEYAQPTRVGSRQPLGYQQITDLSAAVGLTVPDGARFALIQAKTKALVWRDDGTAPTSTVGMDLAAGSTLEYPGDLTTIKLIEAEASATCNVSYYA